MSGFPRTREVLELQRDLIRQAPLAGVVMVVSTLLTIAGAVLLIRWGLFS